LAVSFAISAIYFEVSFITFFTYVAAETSVTASTTTFLTATLATFFAVSFITFPTFLTASFITVVLLAVLVKGYVKGVFTFIGLSALKKSSISLVRSVFKNSKSFSIPTAA